MRLQTEKPTHIIEYGDSKTTVQPMGTTEVGKLKEKYTTYKRGSERIDPDFGFQMFRRIIKDWEGMEGLECNDANKRKVYEHDQPYTVHIIETTRELSEERGELEAKN